MTAAVRPTVSVYSVDDSAAVLRSVPLPDVFAAPIRPDVISKVHSLVSRNNRQAYAVKWNAGMDTAAESWGTGRAVSRIPRVPGGGTHRAGQGAFGNMCRGGRMFAPTKIWRKWHAKVSRKQRRYAVASALAASAVPALVMARGHRINEVPELPLVLDSKVESITKTKEAASCLKKFGLEPELDKVKDSKKIRPGQGKARNRRHVFKKGPLIVTAEKNNVYLAFRNIPGVDITTVEQLNVLKLAPGGHPGRLIIWTVGAFEALNDLFGTREKPSECKKNFVLPRACMLNADLARLINSDEVQKVVRPVIADAPRRKLKKVDPFSIPQLMEKLNPYNSVQRRAAIYAGTEKRRAQLKELRDKKKEAQKKASTRAQRTAFYSKLVAE